jgi:hypothetical protein
MLADASSGITHSRSAGGPHQLDTQAGSGDNLRSMDVPEPPRPDLRPPPAPSPEKPVSHPIWKRWWFWVGVVLVLGVIGTALGSGEGDTEADNPQPTGSTSSQAVPGVADIPVFDGQSGGQVVALVNREGIMSAKVLGELPSTCMVTAGDIVQWDKSASSYQDTGQVAADITGEPGTSLMATFFGPVGTGDQQGYVFHADMDLQPPYPKAIVVTLDCTY